MRRFELPGITQTASTAERSRRRKRALRSVKQSELESSSRCGFALRDETCGPRKTELRRGKGSQVSRRMPYSVPRRKSPWHLKHSGACLLGGRSRTVDLLCDSPREALSYLIGRRVRYLIGMPKQPSPICLGRPSTARCEFAQLHTEQRSLQAILQCLLPLFYAWSAGDVVILDLVIICVRLLFVLASGALPRRSREPRKCGGDHNHPCGAHGVRTRDA